MKKKDRKHLELTVKNILYYVEDKVEQERMLQILEEYNNKLPDSKFKDFLDKIVYKSKKDYFDKIDHLISDIFDRSLNNEEKNIVKQMLNAIKPTIKKAESTIWDKLMKLFDWS